MASQKNLNGRDRMRILVAGGAGYVGSVLIPKLLDRGYQVDVVELFWFGNHLPGEVGIVHKDIFDLSTEDLRGYEQVVFLAGLSNDPMAEFSPSKNFIFNAAAPAYLAYIAKMAGVRRCVYACSCSVYGYTENELYDETRPAVSSYPYGISKLQGEQAVLQLQDDNFSVIALRKGTICGYSPRMRLDLVINTMFKTAMRDRIITVNNPSIWRPILSIEDAATAYVRSIEANYGISGIFNITSGNFTVGELADRVRLAIEQQLGSKVRLQIKHVQDIRNYKVTIQKAQTVLSFHPQGSVTSIISELVNNQSRFCDWDNPSYYNIQQFKALEAQPRAEKALSTAGGR
jgi:nucleoside-diphosphate-sugar epimerase